MSSANNGSQTAQNWNPSLGEADASSVLATLGQLEQSLPFLIGLDRSERKRLSKLGPRSRPFVTDALATATANPGLVPRSVDIDQLRSRADTLGRLADVKQALVQLLEKVSDTEMRLGSEVYGVARTVYAVMKTPATVPGLKERQRQLARRFAVKRESRPEQNNAGSETSA